METGKARSKLFQVAKKTDERGDADVVAALNLLTRVGDPEMHRWTPVDVVKGILDGRFRRRKETGNHLGDDAGVGNGTPLPAGL